MQKISIPSKEIDMATKPYLIKRKQTSRYCKNK